MKSAKTIEVLKNYNTLQANLNIAKMRVRQIQIALETLNRDERAVVEKFFINPTEETIEDLCEELHRERSTIYRLQKKALRKLEIALFGRDILNDPIQEVQDEEM